MQGNTAYLRHAQAGTLSGYSQGKRDIACGLLSDCPKSYFPVRVLCLALNQTNQIPGTNVLCSGTTFDRSLAAAFQLSGFSYLLPHPFPLWLDPGKGILSG